MRYLLDTKILSELSKKLPNPYLLARLTSAAPQELSTSCICVMEQMAIHAFEELIVVLLEANGYWVRHSFKVALTREDKVSIGRPPSPRSVYVDSEWREMK